MDWLNLAKPEAEILVPLPAGSLEHQQGGETGGQCSHGSATVPAQAGRRAEQFDEESSAVGTGRFAERCAVFLEEPP